MDKKSIEVDFIFFYKQAPLLSIISLCKNIERKLTIHLNFTEATVSVRRFSISECK